MQPIDGLMYPLKSFGLFGGLALTGLIAPHYAERLLMRIAIRFGHQLEAGADSEALKRWAGCGR